MITYDRHESERQVGGKYLWSMPLVVLTADSHLTDKKICREKNWHTFLLRTVGFHISACIWFVLLV